MAGDFAAVGPLLGMLVGMSLLFPLAQLVRGVVEVSHPDSAVIIVTGSGMYGCLIVKLRPCWQKLACGIFPEYCRGVCV